MSIEAQLMATGAKSTAVEPDAIDFGTNDHLSRSMDLVGNADGKTLTFSAWVYVPKVQNAYIYQSGEQNGKGLDVKSQNGTLMFVCKDATDSYVLFYSAVVFNNAGLNAWAHISFSCDMATQVASLYINDAPISGSENWYSTNDMVLSVSTHAIAKIYEARVSHLYLDHTYRDLSIEANRRLFITEDGRPAEGQADMSPILYLPLDDFEAPGVNLGTGGDFALNGVVAQSQRGPNQWNCVASEFDGTKPYLSKTNLTDEPLTKMTLSFSYTNTTSLDAQMVSARYNTSTTRTALNLKHDVSQDQLQLRIYDLAGTVITQIFWTLTHVENKNYVITLSFDKSTESAVCFANNKPLPIVANYNIAGSGANPSNFFINSALANGGEINNIFGELYFDTTYIDLAANNPFWDEDTQKPKPVLQVLEETGNSPLIAMPIRADDAGRNYGTGGDFTVNSGPFIGARGASEFWARSVVVDATNYLSHPGITCASLVKWKSTDGGATWAVSYLNNVTVTNIGNGTDNGVVAYYFGTSEVIDWNQEANTLRFTDAFGYPVPPEIDANTLLYLPFDDSANFGKNLGTESDFTVNGTVTPGADVDPN